MLVLYLLHLFNYYFIQKYRLSTTLYQAWSGLGSTKARSLGLDLKKSRPEWKHLSVDAACYLYYYAALSHV